MILGWVLVALVVALLCVDPVHGQSTSLSAQPQNAFVGDRVLFKGASEAPDREGAYVIHFGDGDSLSVAPPDYTAHHIYYEAGRYEAILIVRLEDAVLRSAPIEIIIEPVELRLYFTGESRFIENNLVTFRARFHPPLDQFHAPPDLLYQFYFGEGSESGWQADPEITHRLPHAVVYQVYARVRDSSSPRVLAQSPVLTLNVDSTILAVTHGTPFPEISLYPSTNVIGEGDSVTFAVVLEPEVPGTEYRIHFGDASPVVWTMQDTMSHVYQRAGRFETYAEARQDGMLLARSLPLRIGVRAPYVVVLETDTTGVRAGKRVRFTGAISPPAEGVFYQFSFGDEPRGAWRAEAEADHVFERPGTYAVTLSARLDDGSTFRSEVLAMVVAPPPDTVFVLRLDYKPARPRPREPVVFTAVGAPAGQIVEYRFLFGDGDTTAWSAASQTTHPFAAFGSYDVAVEARGIQGAEQQRASVIVPIARVPFWWLPWIPVIVFMLILWFFWRVRRRRKAAGSELAVKPHLDPGVPQIVAGQPLRFQLEVRFRPVKDPGTTRIETTGDAITKEHRSHARQPGYPA